MGLFIVSSYDKTFLFEPKEHHAICTQRVRFPIQVGADLIIQVGSDLIILCSVIYKFVTTNTFNYQGTIALIQKHNYLL